MLRLILQIATRRRPRARIKDDQFTVTVTVTITAVAGRGTSAEAAVGRTIDAGGRRVLGRPTRSSSICSGDGLSGIG
jgi:hypothetical protein